MKKLANLIAVIFLLPVLILNFPVHTWDACEEQEANLTMNCCEFINTSGNGLTLSLASQKCKCHLAENSQTDLGLVFLTEIPTLKLKRLELATFGTSSANYIQDSQLTSNWSNSHTNLKFLPNAKIYNLISSYLI